MALRIAHPAEGWNQNKQRSVAIFFDQHRSSRHPDGRPWWCYVENPADPSHPKHPVGELTPVVADMDYAGTTIRGWEAPWYPEPKYMAPDLSQLTGSRFRIRYDRMIADYRQANIEYYTRANREAAARNWPSVKLYGDVSFQLRAIVGNPPKSPKIPEAAMAGDQWLLGQSREVNEQLQRLIARDRDTTAISLIEAGLDESGREIGAEPVKQEPQGSHLATLAGFSLDEIVAAANALKQAEKMREAKAAKRASQAESDAA